MTTCHKRDPSENFSVNSSSWNSGSSASTARRARAAFELPAPGYDVGR